jgi:hypothetical protein
MSSDASVSSLQPAAGLTESDTEENVHLAAARRSGVLRCLMVALPCLYIAALLAKLLLNQSHFPSKAGPFLAVAIIGGLALLGLYAARCALPRPGSRSTRQASRSTTSRTPGGSRALRPFGGVGVRARRAAAEFRRR